MIACLYIKGRGAPKISKLHLHCPQHAVWVAGVAGRGGSTEEVMCCHWNFMENVDSSKICEGKRGRGGEKKIREGVSVEFNATTHRCGP